MALVLTAVAAGCQTGTATYQTVRLPGGDYDRTFEITQQVIGEQFTIAQADKKSGRIVTSAQAVTNVLTGGMLTPGGPVQGLRRTVTAQVKPGDGTTLVSVKVQLETAQAVQQIPRPTYSEYEPTTGAQSDIYVRSDQRAGVMWNPAGSDEAMEKQLLTEIETRLKASGVEMETPKATEEKPEEGKAAGEGR